MSDDWTLLEAVRRKGRRPCSDAYAEGANDEELIQIYRELRLLRASGQPPDRMRGNPETQKVGVCEFRELRSKIEVFVLKAKPSGWRLYFYVKDREKRQIEFLYAVDKKQNRRDPEDLKRCRTVLADVFSGRASSQPIEIPDR